jgi:hemolysin D
MDNLSANDSVLLLSESQKDGQSIHVLLVDDQNFVLELLQSYLQPETDLVVVGMADNGQTALDLTALLHPDIVLVDIEMQGMDGLTLTQKISQHFSKTKVMVLSSHDNKDYILRAIQAGAQGYLLKNTPSQELVHAIRFVYRGYLQLGPGLFEKLEGNPLVSVTQNGSSQTNDLVQAEFLESDLNASGLVTRTPTQLPVLAQDGWSSVTQERLDSLPQVWTRGLLYFLAFFAAIALPWSFFSKVDETNVARGKLEPQGATIRLDAKSSGTISSVRVKEGQSVRKGEILLELDSDVLRTELQQAQAKLSGQISQLSQSQLIKAQLLSSIALQAQQNQAQRAEKQAQVAQENQKLVSTQISAPLQDAEKLTDVEKAEATLDEAHRTLIVMEARHKNNLAEVKRYRTLQKAGVIPEVKVVEVEQQANESQNTLIRAEGAVRDAKKLLQGQRKTYEKLQQQLQAEQTQSELRLQEQKGSQKSLEQGGELALSKSQQQLEELQSQLSTLKSEIKQTQKQVQSISLQIEQRVVRSPENGIIFQLPLKKSQAFVQAGQLIAHIAPQGLPLILKAQVSSQQIGQMKTGMPVKMKFDAYPFQDYGVVPGRLRWISPDSKTVDLGQGQGQVEVFELEVDLKQHYIKSAEKRINLTPGQTATVETIIRQRRIIDFILDPFRQLQKGGLKL